MQYIDNIRTKNPIKCCNDAKITNVAESGARMYACANFVTFLQSASEQTGKNAIFITFHNTGKTKKWAVLKCDYFLS